MRIYDQHHTPIFELARRRFVHVPDNLIKIRDGGSGVSVTPYDDVEYITYTLWGKGENRVFVLESIWFWKNITTGVRFSEIITLNEFVF